MKWLKLKLKLTLTPIRYNGFLTDLLEMIIACMHPLVTPLRWPAPLRLKVLLLLPLPLAAAEIANDRIRIDLNPAAAHSAALPPSQPLLWQVKGLSLSGFGTISYSLDDHDQLSFIRDIGQYPARGWEQNTNWRSDSRIGVQMEYRPSTAIEAVTQFVLSDHFKPSWNSRTELAYLGYRPERTAFDFQLGRIRYDAFMLSDYRNVAYAYTWVRPPHDFYARMPMRAVDGINIGYTLPGASTEGRWRVQLQAGQSNLWYPINGGTNGGWDWKSHAIFGLSLNHQRPNWRFKFAYSYLTSESDINELAPAQQGLDQISALSIPGISTEAADLRRNITFKDIYNQYLSVGAAYDDGLWIGQSELSQLYSPVTMVPQGWMGYLSLGRRIDDWTPYLMLGAMLPNSDIRQPQTDWDLVQPGLNANLRDAAILLINSTRVEQYSLSLGLRWDFSLQAAVKLQLDHTQIEAYGHGLWVREPKILSLSSTVNMLTLSVDFTF